MESPCFSRPQSTAFHLCVRIRLFHHPTYNIYILLSPPSRLRYHVTILAGYLWRSDFFFGSGSGFVNAQYLGLGTNQGVFLVKPGFCGRGVCEPNYIKDNEKNHPIEKRSKEVFYPNSTFDGFFTLCSLFIRTWP